MDIFPLQLMQCTCVYCLLYIIVIIKNIYIALIIVNHR